MDQEPVPVATWLRNRVPEAEDVRGGAWRAEAGRLMPAPGWGRGEEPAPGGTWLGGMAPQGEGVQGGASKAEDWQDPAEEERLMPAPGWGRGEEPAPRGTWLGGVAPQGEGIQGGASKAEDWQDPAEEERLMPAPGWGRGESQRGNSRDVSWLADPGTSWWGEEHEDDGVLDPNLQAEYEERAWEDLRRTKSRGGEAGPPLSGSGPSWSEGMNPQLLRESAPTMPTMPVPTMAEPPTMSVGWTGLPDRAVLSGPRVSEGTNPRLLRESEPTMSAMPTMPVDRTGLPDRAGSPDKRYKPYQTRPALRTVRRPEEAGGQQEMPTAPTMSAGGEGRMRQETSLPPEPVVSGDPMEELSDKPRRVDYLDHKDRKRAPATRDGRRSQAGEERKKWKEQVISRVRRATGEKRAKTAVQTTTGKEMPTMSASPTTTTSPTMPTPSQPGDRKKAPTAKSQHQRAKSTKLGVKSKEQPAPTVRPAPRAEPAEVSLMSNLGGEGTQNFSKSVKQGARGILENVRGTFSKKGEIRHKEQGGLLSQGPLRRCPRYPIPLGRHQRRG